MTDNKLKGKDLISIGIYTALYIVALLVGSVATVLPVTFLFYPAVCALLGATFFVMLAAKVQKPGAVVIWGVIVGLVFFAFGMPPALPFMVVGSIAAQIVISLSGYKKFAANMTGFVIVSVCSIGGYFQLFAYTNDYLAVAETRGLSQEYIDTLAGYANIGFLLVMIVATAATAVLGCLFARKIMKKHLAKAGIL